MLNKYLLFVLVLLVTSELSFADDFLLDGKGEVSALVKRKRLELKVDRGGNGEYSAARKFELSIGGCKIGVTVPAVIKDKVILDLNVKGSGDSTTSTDPDKFIVENGEFKASGPRSLPYPIKCDFKFNQFDQRYKIDVGLSGDVPKGFKLSSNTAELYNDQKSKDKIKAAMIGWIIGGSVIAFAAIVASSITAIFFVRRHYRKQEEQQEEDLMKTAVSSEANPEVKLDEKKPEVKPEVKIEVKPEVKIEGKKSKTVKKVDKKAELKTAKSKTAKSKTAQVVVSPDLDTEEDGRILFETQPEVFTPDTDMRQSRKGHKMVLKYKARQERKRKRKERDNEIIQRMQTRCYKKNTALETTQDRYECINSKSPQATS